MHSALNGVKNGDHLPLAKVADSISDSLHAAVIMLKVTILSCRAHVDCWKGKHKIVAICFFYIGPHIGP